MKEIHFYKDNIQIVNKKVFYYTHNSTNNAINNDIVVIHTFAISALDFAYLLEKDYHIFLHENGKSGEIKLGECELTEKIIRKGHDIKRLWIGGHFNNFFYEKE